MSVDSSSPHAAARRAVMALPQQMHDNLRRYFAPLGHVPRPAWTLTLRRTECRAGLALAVVVIAVLIRVVDAGGVLWGRGLPAWFIDPVNWFTDFGKGIWWLLPTGLVVLVVAAVDRPGLADPGRRALAAVAVRSGFLFAAIGAPSLFATIVKRMIGRARPMMDGHAVAVFHPFIWKPEYASLPSGHATTAFAAAFAVGALWPRLAPLVWVYAVAVAFSRVALTAHHVSDVVAGGVVAFVGVVMVRDAFAAQRLGFIVVGDRVRPLPGPSWPRLKSVARSLIAS